MKKLTFLPSLPAVALAKAGTSALAKAGTSALAKAGTSALAKAGALLLLFSALFFTACNNDKKQIEALYKETETIHNEAMKDLADMNRVARELKETIMVATMTPEQSAVYADALTAIGNAENTMMDWMKNFKPLVEINTMPPADALKYLQQQKTLIEKNRADIKVAMEAGKKLQGK